MNTHSPDLQSPFPAVEGVGQRVAMKWVIAATVSLPAIRALVDVNILGPAVRFMEASFPATPAEIGSTIRAYGIASVVGFLALAFGERYVGRKALFLVSLIGFTLASVFCGLASTTGMLLAFRVGQGLAGGGLLAVALAILCELFFRTKPRNVLTIFGVVSGVAGPITGPSLGGYLADSFTWRWIFFADLPLGVVVLILAALLVPRDLPESPRRAGWDWTTIALATLSLASWNYFFVSRMRG